MVHNLLLHFHLDSDTSNPESVNSENPVSESDDDESTSSDGEDSSNEHVEVHDTISQRMQTPNGEYISF